MGNLHLRPVPKSKWSKVPLYRTCLFVDKAGMELCFRSEENKFVFKPSYQQKELSASRDAELYEITNI